MTAFRYRAARPDGELLNGSVEAGSQTAALQLVEARGLFPVAVEEAPPSSGRPKSLPPGELATTLSGLAALLDAGLPMDRALAAVEETAPHLLRPRLARAREQVREGVSLSAALDSAGAISPLVLGYLRAGERSGLLVAAIERAAAELEREAETRARILAALTYPAFLAVAGTVSVTAIVGLVVPRFAALLGGEGRALPPSTRLLVAAAEVLHRGALPLLTLATVGGTLLLRVLRTSEGQLALHRRLLTMPLLGPLRLRLATARVCGALASLFEAAVPMLAALDLARDAAADRAIGERLAAARQDVDRGEPMAKALRRHEALSPTALRLAAFGEQSGRLAIFLRHAARLESAAAQRAIQRAVTLLEPLMILAMGGAVAFVAAALLQAVYSVRPGM